MQQSNLKPISYNTKDDSGFSAAGTVFFSNMSAPQGEVYL
jgi:hypothetical protein